MKLFFKIWVFVSTFLFLAACSMSDSGSTPVNNSSVSTTISTMPEFQVLLPGSLSVEGEGTDRRSRAAGDISTITADGLDAVKSQGWYDMKDNIGMDYTTKIFLDLLKDYAANHDIAMGVPFSIGVQTIPSSEGSMDMGNIMVDGNSSEDFVVYWYIPYPASFLNPESTEVIPYYIYLDVDKTNGNYEVSMNVYLKIPMALLDGPEEDLELFLYTYFNENTGESLLAQNSMLYNVVKKSVPNPSDDSYTIMIKEYNQMGEMDGMTIGWGDDEKGGLASRWNDDWIDVEFYNGQGNLLKKSQGSVNRYTSWLDYYPENADRNVNLYSLSISSAPEEVYLRWNESESLYEYSLDMQTYTSLPGITSFNTFYYKAGLDWNYGDCVYTTSSWNTNVRTYTKSYVVPQQEGFMGKNYFMDNQYPLKFLLPLNGEYSEYSLLGKEGETYEETWTYYVNNKEIEENWSWTEYDYFIDMNDNQSLDYDNDIVINGINFQDVYIWDNNSGDYTIESGAFYMCTESQALPPYFHFSEDNQNIITSVETKLTEIYESTDFTDFALENITLDNPYAEYTDIFETLKNL